ncbi:hypothetical protein ACUJ8N_27835 [Streptomyces sp. ESR1.13]|uniref:Gliding motility protein n=1 Tax=Streptomyces ardesiacus TaxID=285564 RepID=A0ABW8HH05_9ACTN|nr:hypothetical protein [Streptomyces sp. NRRL F-7442]KOX46832.1 hypothetical protein ADL09_17425 [Streptomyces sp. NRRL F-7442]NEB60304.1 hypothetical protein [Streptomyces diastaticus]
MGVFARLFRRSKSTEEASAGETRTGTPDTGGAAEAGTAEAPEPGDAGPRDTAEAGEATGTTGTVAEGGDSESVGIPKQQSAGEAVDNEADKGART